MPGMQVSWEPECESTKHKMQNTKCEARNANYRTQKNEMEKHKSQKRETQRRGVRGHDNAEDPEVCNAENKMLS